MATQVGDVRNNRVVVLVSAGEKLRIAANAKAAAMSVSDFMRTAAERYTEPTATEALLMKDLLAQLEQANRSTEAAFRRLEATEARSAAFDEAAYREQVRAELAARTDVDWDQVAASLGLRRSEAA